MTDLILYGLYSIKDSYFSDFKRPYWMDNKMRDARIITYFKIQMAYIGSYR